MFLLWCYLKHHFHLYLEYSTSKLLLPYSPFYFKSSSSSSYRCLHRHHHTFIHIIKFYHYSLKKETKNKTFLPSVVFLYLSISFCLLHLFICWILFFSFFLFTSFFHYYVSFHIYEFLFFCESFKE